MDSMLPREQEPFLFCFEVAQFATGKRVLPSIIGGLVKKYEIPPTIHEISKVFRETCEKLQERGLLEAGHVDFSPPCYRLTLLGFATCHEKTLSAIRKFQREQRLEQRRSVDKQTEEQEIW